MSTILQLLYAITTSLAPRTPSNYHPRSRTISRTGRTCYISPVELSNLQKPNFSSFPGNSTPMELHFSKILQVVPSPSRVQLLPPLTPSLPPLHPLPTNYSDFICLPHKVFSNNTKFYSKKLIESHTLFLEVQLVVAKHSLPISLSSFLPSHMYYPSPPLPNNSAIAYSQSLLKYSFKKLATPLHSVATSYLAVEPLVVSAFVTFLSSKVLHMSSNYSKPYEHLARHKHFY